ncbi:MAG: hypothetical protein MK141_01830 [Pseudoxanthomonas sp.]|uniref:hypothetical protein n=1 Tax=Pseudoxanthomonas sp. TaxID=1871049 RepID=UPI0025890F2A|nr:hypothetical protein [Pseudoxanthomonas sp.]MCH2090305.1 hypothetical protein [Pseudoxanthomonas sp.]
MALTIPGDIAFMFHPVEQLPPLVRGTETSQILQPGDIAQVTAPDDGQVCVFQQEQAGAEWVETKLTHGSYAAVQAGHRALTLRVVNQPFSMGDASLEIARRVH